MHGTSHLPSRIRVRQVLHAGLGEVHGALALAAGEAHGVGVPGRGARSDFGEDGLQVPLHKLRVLRQHIRVNDLCGSAV